MNEQLTDEIIELREKISTLGEGHSNGAVSYAAVDIIAQHVALTARTRAELEHFSGEINAALGKAIAGYWKERQR